MFLLSFFVSSSRCLGWFVLYSVWLLISWLNSHTFSNMIICLFCFVALRPKSTAMFIVGRSVLLTTLFRGQAWTSRQPVIRAHTFACNWQQPFLNESAEGRRMTVEIISWSISTKVWDRTVIELVTPGSAVRHASVARHVTDCTTWPGIKQSCMKYIFLHRTHLFEKKYQVLRV